MTTFQCSNSETTKRVLENGWVWIDLRLHWLGLAWSGLVGFGLVVGWVGALVGWRGRHLLTTVLGLCWLARRPYAATAPVS